MKRRSVPAIALMESNDEGGHYFMSLLTGKEIHAYDWTSLPIDDDVKRRVESLAEEEKQPRMRDKTVNFSLLTLL